ncbi:MAG: hypothetical protein K2J77_08015, partial [Oscillospiraceae bacterium]|nr:hypothetical protein [Oscillospiraceae bacterium]
SLLSPFARFFSLIKLSTLLGSVSGGEISSFEGFAIFRGCSNGNALTFVRSFVKGMFSQRSLLVARSSRSFAATSQNRASRGLHDS